MTPRQARACANWNWMAAFTELGSVQNEAILPAEGILVQSTTQDHGTAGLLLMRPHGYVKPLLVDKLCWGGTGSRDVRQRGILLNWEPYRDLTDGSSIWISPIYG